LTLIATHAPSEEKRWSCQSRILQFFGEGMWCSSQLQTENSTRELEHLNWKKVLFIPSMCRAQPSQQNKL
jgi:hypothetical protein